MWTENLKKILQYKTDRKTIILIAAIAISLILSTYLINISYSKPVMNKSEITIASFNQNGIFEYVGVLQPNSLYETKTLTSTQGNLFTNIVDVLNVGYKYNLKSDKEFNATVRYTMNAFLISRSTNKNEIILWQKKLPLHDSAEVKFTQGNSSFTRIYQINITETLNLTRTIERQINIRGDTFIEISADIFLKAQTNGYSLDDELPHVLTLSIGNVINSQGDSANSTKRISYMDEVPEFVNIFGFNTEVLVARYLALGSFAVALILICIGARRLFLRYGRRDTVSSAAETINKKYRNLLIKTVTQYPKFETEIHINSIEDLVKLSDDLGKPILYSENKGVHAYSIIDNNMKYVFELKDSGLNAPENP